MTRRIRLLEEDFEQSSGRLTETSTKLDDASKAAEESERYELYCKALSNALHICMLLSWDPHVFSARWRLNNQQSADEMRISELERSIDAASIATQESEWKYEEVFMWCFVFLSLAWFILHELDFHGNIFLKLVSFALNLMRVQES